MKEMKAVLMRLPHDACISVLLCRHHVAHLAVQMPGLRRQIELSAIREASTRVFIEALRPPACADSGTRLSLATLPKVIILKLV